MIKITEEELKKILKQKNNTECSVILGSKNIGYWRKKHNIPSKQNGRPAKITEEKLKKILKEKNNIECSDILGYCKEYISFLRKKYNIPSPRPAGRPIKNFEIKRG